MESTGDTPKPKKKRPKTSHESVDAESSAKLVIRMPTSPAKGTFTVLPGTNAASSSSARASTSSQPAKSTEPIDDGDLTDTAQSVQQSKSSLLAGKAAAASITKGPTASTSSAAGIQDNQSAGSAPTATLVPSVCSLRAFPYF